MNTPDSSPGIEPINNAQRAIVETRTHALINSAGQLFDLCLPPITIGFDLRGRAAGMFRKRHNQCEIRYNPWIFARYFEENLADTVPHEVAHFVVAEQYRGRRVRPHGSEWKRVAVALGATPKATCNYDLAGIPRRTYRQFNYHCGCGAQQLGSIRHHRILRRRAVYHCRRCRQPLQPGAAPG